MLKDVRKLFASRVVTVDEEPQKVLKLTPFVVNMIGYMLKSSDSRILLQRIRQLEATCAALEKKVM